MGLKDTLKNVQEQGRDATRRVLGHARDTWEDAERRIRANMRIHPRSKVNVTPANNLATVETVKPKSNSADPALNDEMSKAQAASGQRKGKTNAA